MKGLNVIISRVKPPKSSLGLLNPLILVLILLLILPLLLLIVFAVGITQLFRKKENYQTLPEWTKVENASTLGLEYSWVKSEKVPNFLTEFHKERGLAIFRSSMPIEFFEGYFSDFIVKREDGIFVQKLILDEAQQQLKAAPLFFFKFCTRKIEEIYDLKDFEFDCKGNPDNFVIEAYSLNENIQIRLSKSEHNP